MWTLCLKKVDPDSPLLKCWLCIATSSQRVQGREEGKDSDFVAEIPDKYYFSQMINTSSDQLC